MKYRTPNLSPNSDRLTHFAHKKSDRLLFTIAYFFLIQGRTQMNADERR
ncbi:MAG: hypothetical protein ACKO99_08740 [Dolichospermum sp.]